MTEASAGRGARVAEALIVLALAATTRVGLLGAPPEFDELYHLLAVRSWLEDETLSILDGEYARTALYTVAVGRFLSLTGGDSLEAARLTSVAAGALLPVALFLWMRSVAGRTAALFAATFAILWPQGILEAQLFRFYALHSLAFTLGAIGVFQATATAFPAFPDSSIPPRPGRRARVVWAATAAAGLLVAAYLQLTTVIGLAGLALWFALAAGIPALWERRRDRRLLIGASAAAVLVFGVAWASSLPAQAWALYRWTPGHAADLRDYIFFYHANLRTLYPTLWPLFPFAALIALGARPRVTFFCLVLFATSLAVQSGGGMKAMRYLSYAMPFFFALWGIALAAALPLVVRALQAAVGAGARALAPGPLRRWGPPALGFVAVVFLAASNAFIERSLTFALGRGLPPRGDWSGAAAAAADWAAAAPFLATTRELHMITYLGDYDLLLSSSRLSELDPPEEFGLDPRTGRPVSGSEAAFAAILDCRREGLLVTSPHFWSDAREEVRLPALFAEKGLRTELRQEGRALLLVRWSDPSGAPPRCQEVPKALRPD